MHPIERDHVMHRHVQENDPFRITWTIAVALIALQDTMAVAWKSTLNKALEANKQLKYSTFFQLATVRPDGKPSNRTVVFRGFLDDSTKITFTSDTR